MIVITVKLGLKDGENAAGVTARNLETGEVAGFTFSGSRELLEYLLKAFESQPSIKIRYE